ncbi:hypothetical protein E1281_25910 [Actinomadura sp. KC345]|uniref:hypothetical protein n=1 Tax=Actinomadura sp. KC345 TaxID=2530371 RepID=UPI001043EAC4|nr:hypothetical protein [Actinomadura sp. KC345]TDC47639.1 hypothetical protein E1281_25910 [Actinomadura sp. KC345]
MAKSSGLGDNLYIDGVDVSGDIGSLGNIGGGPAALEMTGINKSAIERRGGVRDGAIEFTSFFNPSEDETHDVLSMLPTADRLVSYYRGTAAGGWAANLVAKQIGYDPTRGEDGALTLATQAQANGYGLEWARQLTAGKRSDTEATDGTSLDLGAASSFGLQAYVQVFSFTGTSVTIKLQGSSDDAAADAFADITDGDFTAVTTAPTAERIQTARDAAIERYIRVVTTGTFTECTFAVSVAINKTAVTF